MSKATLLSVKSITKKFGGLVALNNVNITVYEGEILGLIGPNGAGKTTLFNVISGVYKPEGGRVFFDSVDITRKPPHQITRMGIARTHQIVKPFNEMTVLENTMIGALFGRLASRITMGEARKKALETLEFVGLIDNADAPASKLTLHEKKTLELARALAAEPKLLLLDEELAGLNPKEIEESLNLIKQAKDEKELTIIMVEHVMHAVMNIAERIVVLHHGEKIAEGTPMEIANTPRVIEAYLGEKELALKFVKKLKPQK